MVNSYVCILQKIMRAECVDTRSKSMEMLSIEQLCTLLKFALERMKHNGVSLINSFEFYLWLRLKITHALLNR